jgi:hypothetical protein
MNIFGKLNPKIMDDYQHDYIRKTEEDYKRIDFAAWKQGEYTISAIAVALSPKKAKYPKHPHSFDSNDEPQQNVTIQARKFEDWANVWNKNYEQKSSVGTE